MIEIPEDKVEQAKKIMARIEAELEAGPEEEYVGYSANLEDGGMWIRHDESINTDHAERLVKALVEELDIPGIIVCSWAYTCSRPRLDEFGGGAFAVQKGRDTIWIDAASEALRQAYFLNERLAHPRRGGKPEFKLERCPPLDEATCSAFLC